MRHKSAVENGLTVLVIEDDQVDAEAIDRMLEESSGNQWAVTHVDCLSDGLDRLGQYRIDVVLLDLGLPDSRGLETLGKFRAEAPNLPVVVLTGADDEMIGLDAVKQGAQEYLVKGQADHNLLVRSLRYAIERNRLNLDLHELSEIVEHSDDAIFRIDLDGTIRTWNKGAVRIYGYSTREIVGKHIGLLRPQDHRDKLESILERLRAGHSIDHLETRWLRRDGAFIDVSLTVSPIRADQEKIAAASVVARNITKQKQAEAEVRDAVRQRDQFLAVLSHELRNPMAAILNSANVLKEEGVPAETELEARGIIERHVRYVARLLDDLLEVSRVTHDKIRLHREVVDIRTITMDVVECVQPQVDEKRQQLHVQTSDEPLLVEVDVGRLQQAQVNLLVNASKYTGEGGTIEYTTMREGNAAVIRVSDNGEGIPKSSITDIFEPFTQADQTLDRSQGGMGLGLPLVRMIVEAHGGTVLAVSDGRARGSEFTIRLPLTDAPQGPGTENQMIDIRGKKMLVVEDNPGICKMLALSMEMKGLDVAMATDSQFALEIFDEFDPDFAVIDIGLPGLNGYELARRIRSKSRFGNVLMVAITGYGRESDRQQGLSAGFNLYLVKPLDPDELLQAITSHCALAD